MSARRRLTLNCGLLDEARALDVNVSRPAEEGVAQAVAAERTRRWQEENAAALEAYNRLVARKGVPFAAYRKF